MIPVGVKIRQIPFQRVRHELSVLLRDFQHLMPGILDRPGLVRAHVPGVRRDHALIVRKHGGNDHRVRLRAAREKFNVRVRHADGRPNLFLRAFAISIRAVPRQTFKIRLREPFKHLRMRPRDIIAFKRNHRSSSRRRFSSGMPEL